MNIRLILVGKTEAQYLKQGIEEYRSRLVHYCKFSILEIPELKNAKALSREQIKEKEGELILKNIAAGEDVIPGTEILENLAAGIFRNLPDDGAVC